MMSIPFTQYILPNGRQQQIEIGMSPDVEEKAHELIKRGCHFDAEILTTGEVSFTCERCEDLLSQEICENGPPVIEAVRKLVEEAFDLI
jgi:hypothetical protein